MLRLTPLLLFAALLPAQEPPPAASKTPAGFENPDHDIEIGVRPGLLRYATERFAVTPGSKVKLTLVNNDSMQHNLLICRPGEDVTRKVGMLALQLGAQATAKDFIPDSPDILHHTRAILPGERDTIWFTAPTAPGAYPYVCTLPGHMFTMVGVMQVGEVPATAAAPLSELRFRAFDGSFKMLPDFATLEAAIEDSLPDGLIDLTPLQRRQNYAAQFHGALNVAEPGRYTFLLNSDDGSRLLIDGRMIVEWDGTHAGGKERTGEVELTAGRHELQLDYFQGGGGQLLRLAYEAADVERIWLSAQPPARRAPEGTPIMVHHAPRVLRVHVEGAAARSISVGLLGGINYCFDADRCAVQFGWLGAFLDVAPDRQGRGGQPCKTLGPRFAVGDLGFPLRTEDGGERPARYRGYRSGDTPEFLVDWDGREVTWRVTAPSSGIGLRYTFEIAGEPRETRFVYDPAVVRCTAESGTAADGVVTLTPTQSRRFSLTLNPLQEGEE